MARKVFISFLGATNYTPAKYYVEGQLIQTIPELRFVQEVTIKAFCQSFEETDKVFILTTQEALKNWNDGEHQNRKTNTNEWLEGLKSRLEKLDLLCELKNIMVPDGQTKEEIWEIFNTIFRLFQENDQVYFDITHGFRTLPMLNLVLINYAKLLLDIKVAGIYYGAFDAKMNIDGVEVAPIWDLTDFAKLQDWTNNASLFLNAGNAEALTQQITSHPYQPLKKYLKAFSEFTLGNRGLDIYDGQTILKLRNELQSDIEPEDPAFAALKPILNKINEEFNAYRLKSSINGFLAVKWCIQNGLIQQAFTLLEEFITTFLMEELEYGEYISDSKKRTTISAALTIGKGTEFKYDEENDSVKKWQQEAVEKINGYENKKKLGKIANKIKKSARDDISHAGFRANPRTFDEFKTSAIKRYKEVRNLLKKIKGIELPELS